MLHIHLLSDLGNAAACQVGCTFLACDELVPSKYPNYHSLSGDYRMRMCPRTVTMVRTVSDIVLHPCAWVDLQFSWLS